jgi:selenocysteine lyase/cysteine desulfurase
MSHSVSRRSFLFEIGSSAAILPAAAAYLGKKLPRDSDVGERHWEMVRQQFPFTEEKVPMNAANLCPSPRVVADRVTALTRDIDVDCSFNNRGKFADLREEARRKIAGHLGVTPDEIAITRNTSEGNNMINNGLPLSPGDEVVIWDQNHPTNNVAWDVRAARFDLTITRVATPRQPSDTAELIDVFKRALTPKTRVLSITHLSNVSGQLLPCREICEMAHAQGVHVHVDGAQTWGALKFSLSEMGCDSYASSSHKWFIGPKEAGVLYVKKDRIPEIWPNVVAPGWGPGAETTLVGARKFESLGQRDDACVSAMGTTVDFHNAIGPDRISARVYELAAALKEGVKKLGIPLVTPTEPELSGGVCILDVARDKRRPVFNRLYEEYGIACATSGGVRFSPHIYNTMDHIERALEAVRDLRSMMV